MDENSIDEIVTNFRSLLIVATDYLKSMKAQHVEALKNKIIKEVISSISNIQFTDLILSNKFEVNLRRIKGVCDGERNSLYKS